MSDFRSALIQGKFLAKKGLEVAEFRIESGLNCGGHAFATDGHLMPGQFARLQMGQPKTEPALLVSERAVGTDQNKKFVMVVDAENKAAYREVTLGPAVEGLRVVTSGLTSGERIVVSGLQRVRPGAPLAPEVVAMDSRPELQAQASSAGPNPAAQ